MSPSTEAFIEVELNGHRIEQQDIDALLQEGRQAIDPQGRMAGVIQPPFQPQAIANDLLLLAARHQHELE